jgi:pilus assembly protein CpaE
MTVLAVVSPKGGCGKTTVAVNLAVSLARREPVSLLDLDVQFGDVEYAMRVHPVHRINDAVRRISLDPNLDLEAMLAQHHSGVGVLCAPANPVEADTIDFAGAMKVFDHLVESGRPLVVDTAAGINEFTLGALERATHYVTVTGTDVASVHAAHKLIEAMGEVRLDLQRLRLVINRSTLRTGLTVADVEAVLGTPASLRIPDDPAVSASINSGQPFAMSGTDTPLAKLFHSFVDELCDVEPAVKNPRRWKRAFT